MLKKSTPVVATLLLLCLVFVMHRGRAADAPTHPLRSAELLALVAGSALPENIVNDIKAYGLAFRPDDSYKALLTTAGAGPAILSALDSAKITAESRPDAETSKELLQHISTAGKLLNDKKYNDAVRELTAALLHDPTNAEAGFVMGQVLRQTESWGPAQLIYEQILRESPGFPEAHTKLSFVLYRAGDAETALTEAKAALKQTPENAEAQKNVGLALSAMHKFDASEAAFQESLRLKPDYESSRMDLGIMFESKGDSPGAIEQFKKAIQLQPDNPDAFYEMGASYDQTGDFTAAILAYREAKRLAPNRYNVRQNLGAELMNHGHPADAVAEFRELVALYPDTEMCTYSLGLGLYLMGNFDEAEPVFRKAAALDPSDPNPHLRLGYIFEDQKHDDEAMKEYAIALNLDESSADARKELGRLLLNKKDNSGAVAQLKQAADLQPADATIHELYAKALGASGRNDEAIGEFKQSISLDPTQVQIRIELAAALEKKGDWVAAIDEYRHAALADASVNFEGKIIRSTDRDPQREFKDAQQRLDAHLAALKSAGKSQEAASIESRIKSGRGTDSLSDQVDAAIQAGTEADKQRNYDEGLRDYQKAVDLANQLQPHDPRLVTALDGVGDHYLGQNPAAAQVAFERELKVAQEVFGAQSPQLTEPLQSLGRNAMMQHDYPTAEKFFFRAVDLNEKVFGEGSDKVAEALVRATSIYFMTKDYAKAEPYLLRAVRIDEALYGADNVGMLIPRGTLCGLYDRWEQPAKAAECDRILLVVLEKQYGENSPVLVSTLASQAKALHALGHQDEATKLDQRVAQIRAATMNPN
ncbi:MAG TPA: tetratricopeptide repeat protein [Candidatus Acidoferrum sp.]|jgi:tetratricopeptide (TPR) repeat protein